MRLRGPSSSGGHVLVGAGDVRPDGLLLKWIEEEAGVTGAGVVAPGVEEEGLPVEDGGRGPGGEAFGAAGAMKGGGERSGGALAGGYDQAACAQPRGDFGFRFRLDWLACPHFRVIRHWTRGTLKWGGVARGVEILRGPGRGWSSQCRETVSIIGRRQGRCF